MDILVFLALLAATPEKTAPPENAVVTHAVVNMYSRATTDADVVSQAMFSTNVTILEQDSAWLKIRTPDDYSGWIQGSAVVRQAPYAQSGRVARVEALFANVYRETDITKHQPLIAIPFESRLEVLNEPRDEEGRWVEVRLPDGRSAWVQSGDVSLAPQGKTTVGDLMEWSKRFIGLPYLWGGVSTYGYDCSGFIQMLFRRLGYSLPRDAGPQANWDGFKPVEKADLAPGDMLYFGISFEKISHTGMYIGNGRFINATAYQRPMVQICNLGDEHWTELFVAARRIK
jgi:cell wall-associated NlpC family hydrolase